MAVVGIDARFSNRANVDVVIERTMSSCPPSDSSKPLGTGNGSADVDVTPSTSGTTTKRTSNGASRRPPRRVDDDEIDSMTACSSSSAGWSATGHRRR